MPSETTFDVDDDLRLRNAMPTGPPGENHPARPNILMFGDGGWQGDRRRKQVDRFYFFEQNTLRRGVPFVVIEIGAGTKFGSDCTVIHVFYVGRIYLQNYKFSLLLMLLLSLL